LTKHNLDETDLSFFLKVNELKSSHDSWSELAVLIDSYHKGKINIYGCQTKGRFSNSQIGWGLKDTARVLGLSISTVSIYLMLFNFMRNNNELNFKEIKIEDAIKRAREERRNW